jgi:hypothetical protein
LFERVQVSVMQVAEPCNFVWFSVVVVMHFADAVADHARFAFKPSLRQSFCWILRQNLPSTHDEQIGIPIWKAEGSSC